MVTVPMEASVPPEALRPLLDRLHAVGLDEKDALIYVHLCIHGPTKASDMAAAARLNRTEAYRSLDNLMRRGFVTAGLDRPTLYEATPPEKVFDEALAHHMARRTQLERAREVAIESLNHLRLSKPGAPLKSGYKLLQGRAAIYAATEAMVRRARRSQWMVSTYFSASHATEQNTLYRTTMERAVEGIPMRFLLRETPGIVECLAPAVDQKGVELRFFDPEGPVRFTIVDDREVLMWLVTDPSDSLHARDDVAMWTNAQDFVYAQKLLYASLWERAAEPKRP